MVITSHAIREHLAWLTMRGLSPRTKADRERFLRQLDNALEGRLMEADEAMLMDWRSSLRLTADATSGYVSQARQFYAWATRQGYFDASPAAGLPSPRVPRRLPRPISENELAAALGSAPRRIRLWLVLAAWAGLRACEIAYLRSERILLSQDQPVILIGADATKGLRERIVPLCEFAAAETWAAGLPRRGWAFTRHDGQPGPNKPWLVSKLANDHLHDCAIDATLHQLRHRFGTMTYRSSLDLLLVQDMMGHADPRTTAGYAAYDNAAGRRAVDAIPAPRRLRTAG